MQNLYICLFKRLKSATLLIWMPFFPGIYITYSLYYSWLTGKKTYLIQPRYTVAPKFHQIYNYVGTRASVPRVWTSYQGSIHIPTYQHIKVLLCKRFAIPEYQSAVCISLPLYQCNGRPKYPQCMRHTKRHQCTCEPLYR